MDGKIFKSDENTDARAFKDVKVFAGDNFYEPADGSYSNLIWESLGTKIQKNHQLATIDDWGPLFKISFDLIIYSKVFHGQSQYSSVLAFRGNGAVNDWVKYGDGAPAILYKRKTGELHFTNAVSGNRNFAIDHHIELNELYHIEIVQEEKDGKVG